MRFGATVSCQYSPRPAWLARPNLTGRCRHVRNPRAGTLALRSCRPHLGRTNSRSIHNVTKDKMPQYIAFLRGINVGGHRVKMDRLREVFEESALTSVSTFIASGNVIFSSDSDDASALTDRIEQHLAQELGYEVATFLRSPSQLQEIAAFEAPEVTREGRTAESETAQNAAGSVYVMLLREPASEALRASLMELNSETDQFHSSGCEVYWSVQGKVSESPLFGTKLERATRGVSTTMRNINTMRRLAAKTIQ